MIQSITAISYELDDIETAVRELREQIKEGMEFNEESVGILYGHPHTDVGKLSARLNEELGIDVIGGTTAGGATLTNDGHHELAVTLHVITAKDCRFAVSISRSLSEDAENGITETYQKALSGLKEPPKLVFGILSILQNYSSDDALATLERAADHIPIFGFLAADDFEFAYQRVFLNGEAGDDRFAVLLISGNIKPVFAVSNLSSTRTLTKKQVTKSHGNVICEIEGKPAYEYIKDFPFINDETQILWNYQFFTEMKAEVDSEGVIVSRALSNYNKETGEIFCFAHVPEGSYISLRYCTGEDVKASCEQALNALKMEIDQEQRDGYRYSTVLALSCSLRNMFLADQKDAEGNLIKKMVSPDLTVSGVYPFGEIAPASVDNGKAFNCLHNATMTICAI